MARRHPHATCRYCGKTREENGGLLSALGRCTECAERRVIENIVQLKMGDGPYYDHWVRKSFLKAHVNSLILEQKAS